jgi:hypothetical protein
LPASPSYPPLSPSSTQLPRSPTSPKTATSGQQGHSPINGSKKDDRGMITKRHSHSSELHTNLYTNCGRHSDDWLFGGFSLSRAVKRIWERK